MIIAQGMVASFPNTGTQYSRDSFSSVSNSVRVDHDIKLCELHAFGIQREDYHSCRSGVPKY